MSPITGSRHTAREAAEIQAGGRKLLPSQLPVTLDSQNYRAGRVIEVLNCLSPARDGVYSHTPQAVLAALLAFDTDDWEELHRIALVINKMNEAQLERLERERKKKDQGKSPVPWMM